MHKIERNDLIKALKDDPQFKEQLIQIIFPTTKRGTRFTSALQKHDRYYMRLAEEAAKASKCGRAKYGSVIISANGEPITTAYNGKPRDSCNDCICYRENLPPNAQKENCCIHSETNALLFSNPERRRGGTIYVSGVSCKDCALLLMQSGLSRVVFQDKPEAHAGHKGGSDEEFWRKYNVDIEISTYDEAEWEAYHAQKEKNYD